MFKYIKSICTLLLAGIIVSFTWSGDGSFEESKARGEKVYNDLCVTCHMTNGEGTEGVFPPLAGADYLLESPEKSIRALKFGLFGEIEVNGVIYNNAMPPQGLSDQEITDVMNYILNSWGNDGGRVTIEEVKSIEQ